MRYGRSWISIFQECFASIEKFSFFEEDWVLRYNSVKVWDFLDITYFSNFLNSFVVQQPGRNLIYTMFFSNNQALFHLWWREIWSKIKKSSKYYDHDSTLFWFLKISKLWNCYIGLLFLFLLFFILFIFLEIREYSKRKIEEISKYCKIIHTVSNL